MVCMAEALTFQQSFYGIEELDFGLQVEVREG
jgi:hypothetical protein